MHFFRLPLVALAGLLLAPAAFAADTSPNAGDAGLLQLAQANGPGKDGKNKQQKKADKPNSGQKQKAQAQNQQHPKQPPKPQAQPKPKPKAEPKPKPAPKPKAEPKPKPAPKPKAEPKPAPKPKAEPKPAPKPKAEPKPVPKPKAEPKPAPKPKAEPKPAPKPKADGKPKQDAKPKPAPKPNKDGQKPEPKKRSVQDVAPSLEPKPDSEPGPEPTPDPKPEPAPEEPKVPDEPASKPDPTPVKPDQKPGGNNGQKDGKNQGGKNQGGKNQGGKNQGGKNQDGQKQSGQKPNGQKPNGQKKDAQKPAGQQKSGQKPNAQQKDGQKKTNQPSATQQKASPQRNRDGDRTRQGTRDGSRDGDRNRQGSRDGSRDGSRNGNKAWDRRNADWDRRDRDRDRNRHPRYGEYRKDWQRDNRHYRRGVDRDELSSRDLLTGLAIGAVVGAAAPVLFDNGQRRFVEDDGRVYVYGNDRQRFDVYGDGYTERLPDGRTREVYRRPDGTEIITVRGPDGYILTRTRRYPNGQEVVLIDDFRRGPPPPVVLGPVQYAGPRDQYVVDYGQASREDLYGALMAQPVERLPRTYTLEEVREYPRIRERMPRVDISTVTFDTDSSVIEESQVPEIEYLADVLNEILEENPEEVFMIEGHTDATGPELYNLALSDRRAESVAIVLTDYYGIPPENLVTQGYGEEYLEVPTEGPERRNRRVTVRRITPLIRQAEAQ